MVWFGRLSSEVRFGRLGLQVRFFLVGLALVGFAWVGMVMLWLYM